MTKQDLITSIEDKVYQNTEKKISGEKLQQTLINIVDDCYNEEIEPQKIHVEDSDTIRFLGNGSELEPLKVELQPCTEERIKKIFLNNNDDYYTSQIWNNKLYLIKSGEDSAIEVFDLETETSRTIILSTSFYCGGTIIWNNKLYMVTSNWNCDILGIFDLETETFRTSTLATKWQRCSNHPQIWNNKLYTFANYNNILEIFDLETETSRTITTPSGGNYIYIFKIYGNNLYIIGFDIIAILDLETETSRTISIPIKSRYTVDVWNNKLYIPLSTYENFDGIDVFDMDTETFRTIILPPYSRHSCRVFANKLYMLGVGNKIEIFDLETEILKTVVSPSYDFSGIMEFWNNNLYLTTTGHICVFGVHECEFSNKFFVVNNRLTINLDEINGNDGHSDEKIIYNGESISTVERAFDIIHKLDWDKSYSIEVIFSFNEGSYFKNGNYTYSSYSYYYIDNIPDKMNITLHSNGSQTVALQKNVRFEKFIRIYNPNILTISGEYEYIDEIGVCMCDRTVSDKGIVYFNAYMKEGFIDIVEMKSFSLNVGYKNKNYQELLPSDQYFRSVVNSDVKIRLSDSDSITHKAYFNIYSCTISDFSYWRTGHPQDFTIDMGDNIMTCYPGIFNTNTFSNIYLYENKWAVIDHYEKPYIGYIAPPLSLTNIDYNIQKTGSMVFLRFSAEATYTDNNMVSFYITLPLPWRHKQFSGKFFGYININNSSEEVTHSTAILENNIIKIEFEFDNPVTNPVVNFNMQIQYAIMQ